MSKPLSPGGCRIAIQVCAASAVAALLSGCSSDSMRFNDPFTNPFSNTTGSVQKPQHVATTAGVGTGRTPPVKAQALPPVASAAPAKPATASNDVTGSISVTRTVPGASFGGWSATGGADVTVAQGETADVIAKRYGVPENVLLQVNGLHAAAELQPGARITIPIYNAVATSGAPAAPKVAAVAQVRAPLAHPVSPAPARVVVAAAAPARVVVAAPAPARVVVEPSRVAVAAPRVAAAPRVVALAPVVKPGKVAPKAVVAAPAKPKPAPAVVAAKTPAAPKVAVAPAAMVAPSHLVKGAAPVRTAALEAPPKTVPAAPPKTAVLTKPVALKTPDAQPKPAVDATPTASVPPPSAAAPAAPAEASPEFRWPARGRIIQGFKAGAGGNDGINISVPEGTPIKAAEGGVVAYAGSELKGYGNMVLIRHPNGFVSAYANNGEIEVKKGDTVKRGQLIAKSGQTGNVTSPQLHFELRKGATPVDPTGLLAGT